MINKQQRGSLQVNSNLAKFIEEQALPGTDISPQRFWDGFSSVVSKFMPLNRALIEQRAVLQEKIDNWHKQNPRQPIDKDAYITFLKDIGYLRDDLDNFLITTDNVDDEIASIAGPQLVVPITNARYVLNAVNARWGSLYDALYGSDVLNSIVGASPSNGYDPKRGQQVISWGRAFLDDIFPLSTGSHTNINRYEIKNGALLADGIPLKNHDQLIGYQGEADAPQTIILNNNNLHVQICFDDQHPVGKTDKAHIADIKLEAAITTIMDCEDSVVSVDGEDKRAAYVNWLGVMKGDLQTSFTKDGKTVNRKLADNITFTDPNGQKDQLKGISVVLVRNVGLLMTTPAVINQQGEQIPEEILDAMTTIMIAIHDLKHNHNSRTGSIYIVKPKMHGPDEVRYACNLFGAVEDALGLPRHTVKIGIMDEERRTTLNLKACIHEAKERVVFINTGFLDRTGDEIHTSMHAGAMVRKADMKAQGWIKAYEDWNVDIGLECGLSGKAQIGKGMWAMPDMMAAMLEQKIGHPQSGANCAWVPSPTAATLHATHYHSVNVLEKQKTLTKTGRRRTRKELLAIPLAQGVNWSEEEVLAELENNVQSILGYVVRWVDQGIGCSKVLDIANIGLMEDRATLRISSQHIANWLLHGVTTKDQVMDVMKRMATIVDAQNVNDDSYQPMAPNYDGIAFAAACDLVFKGTSQPSGYTEPILHAKRLDVKSR